MMLTSPAAMPCSPSPTGRRAVPLVHGGKIRALAVPGSQRSSGSSTRGPEHAEAGYPEVDIGLWSRFI